MLPDSTSAAPPPRERGGIRSALVVGAGIIGAAAADRLQAEGCAVTVFEAEIPAGGTTAAGMGHLVVLDDSPAQMALCARSLALWREQDLPAACEREPRGTLWVAADAPDMDEAAAKLERYRACGLEAELLDAGGLAAAEPALRPGLAGGLLVPDDQILYPVGAARFLLERAVARGARLRREAVRALEPGGLRTDQGRYQGDVVVLAAGLGTPALLPDLPVTPRRGHLAITDRVPGLVRHQLLEFGYLRSAHGRDEASVAFNVQPRATGQVLIGSSREFAGTDPGPNRALLARMLAAAAAFVPALARVPVVRVWTGFRPCGPGQLPVVGPWPGREGLLVAAGHEGLGITTALATAELLAHHALGARCALDPAPYLPEAVHA